MYHSLNITVIRPVMAGMLVVSALLLSGCQVPLIKPPVDTNAGMPYLSLVFDHQGTLVEKSHTGVPLSQHDKSNEVAVITRAEVEILVREARALNARDETKGLMDEKKIEVWRIIGSHYYLYCLGSRCYKILLPHR
ncbi:MAG TPA: hypothetical protein VIS52_00550 [Motiliproteus sp.]